VTIVGDNLFYYIMKTQEWRTGRRRSDTGLAGHRRDGYAGLLSAHSSHPDRQL
jgi:hypothetical protein